MTARDDPVACDVAEVRRIVVLAPGGTISMPAIDWCARMGIALSFVASDSTLLNCMTADPPHDGPVKRAQAISAVTAAPARPETGILASKGAVIWRIPVQTRTAEVLPMTAEVAASSAGPKPSVRWKFLLPMLCAVATVVLCAAIVDSFGFGAKPWFGYWDSLTATTERPFVAQIVNTIADGAAARAGIHDGDRVDLRNVSVYDRVALLFQPVTTKPMSLVVARKGKSVTTRLIPSTLYEGNSATKIPGEAVGLLALLWALGCAWVVALRRWQTREGRYLCLALLAIVGLCAEPGNTAWPNGIVGALLVSVQGLTLCVAALLPVALAATFGARSALRRSLEIAAVIAAAILLGGYVVCTIGLLSASIDPLPFVYGTFWRLMGVVIYAVSVTAVLVATADTVQPERARAAWLLLPLPIGLLLYSAATQLLPAATSWIGYMALVITGAAALLASVAAVTFALLKRRVLDFQFVVGRTLVVAGVSAVILASFALLEWLLGTVLTNVSHATGLVANAALALGLGLSMSFIHKRVDAFVDFAFFHKRHDDERALRDFAKEAAFVTSRDDLLDYAIENVRMHTDAKYGAVLLDGHGRYSAVRWYGEAPEGTSENDGAVLALKSKHTAIDLHRYTTALRGDVALPMLARGRLMGVLLCGARVGGEAYAPDEIDALTEFAQGVGSALDSIDHTDGGRLRDDAILSELRALREEVKRLAPSV